MASLHEFEPFSGREPTRSTRVSEPSPLRMARLIEGEIIPRLLLAHRGDRGPVLPPTPAVCHIVESDVTALAHLTLRSEVFGLVGHLELFLARGVTIEAIHLDLLAPAARMLGGFWEQDVCDFVDVTMGLWRLQQVVHELAGRATSSVTTRPDRRVLFTVVPGDQHSFGLVMIEEFFRRAGWRTWSASDAGVPELCEIVGRQWFELVGITVSASEHVVALPSMIDAIRGASQNPSIGIMVGGKPLSDDPQLLAQTGADATAGDGRLALIAAEQLVERLARHAGSRAAL